MLAITPHGLSERRREAVRDRGLTLLDATCPIVKAAHRAVATLVRDGCHPVIVGTPQHVEVRGLTEDLAAFDVVSSDEDVEALRPQPRFGVAAQTTQPIERVRHLESLLKSRHPRSEVQVAETVCIPTRLRQESAEMLAAECDVIVVVGSAGSNNTHELAATCRRRCPRVFLVQDARDLRSELVRGRASGWHHRGHVHARGRDRWRRGGGAGSRAEGAPLVTRLPLGSLGLLDRVPDDPFYAPRRPLWLPPSLAFAPVLDPHPSAGPVEPRFALLLNPFYAKSPHGSFGKHVLTPSLALTTVAGATPPGWRLQVPGTRTSCRGRRPPPRSPRSSASPCT